MEFQWFVSFFSSVAIRFLRTEDVLLIPIAADVQHRDVRPGQDALHGFRLPVLVPRRMSFEAGPGRQAVDAVLLAEVLEGREPEVPVIPVVAVELERRRRSAWPFHARRVLHTERLPECALMKEIVAHPGVGHRGLRRDRFEGGVRIHTGDPREPSRIGHAHHPDAAVVVRNVLDEPVDRVVGVGRFVHAFRVLRIMQRAVHHELPGRLARAACVLEHEGVAIPRQFLISRPEGAGLEVPVDAVGRPDQHDRQRRCRGLRRDDDGMERHAVPHPIDTSRRSQSSARVGSCARGGTKAPSAGARNAKAARANRRRSMTRTDSLLGMTADLIPCRRRKTRGLYPSCLTWRKVVYGIRHGTRSVPEENANEVCAGARCRVPARVADPRRQGSASGRWAALRPQARRGRRVRCHCQAHTRSTATPSSSRSPTACWWWTRTPSLPRRAP